MSGGSKISSEDYLESAADLGADRVFAKPFALSDMLTAIKELIEE
jgi:DNA-binding response OmpR family regulator